MYINKYITSWRKVPENKKIVIKPDISNVSRYEGMLDSRWQVIKKIGIYESKAIWNCTFDV